MSETTTTTWHLDANGAAKFERAIRMVAPWTARPTAREMSVPGLEGIVVSKVDDTFTFHATDRVTAIRVHVTHRNHDNLNVGDDGTVFLPKAALKAFASAKLSATAWEKEQWFTYRAAVSMGEFTVVDTKVGEFDDRNLTITNTVNGDANVAVFRTNGAVLGWMDTLSTMFPSGDWTGASSVAINPRFLGRVAELGYGASGGGYLRVRNGLNEHDPVSIRWMESREVGPFTAEAIIMPVRTANAVGVRDWLFG